MRVRVSCCCLSHHHHHLHHLHLLKIVRCSTTEFACWAANTWGHATLRVLIGTVLARAVETKFAFNFRMEEYAFFTVAASWEILAFLSWMNERTLIFIHTIRKMLAPYLLLRCFSSNFRTNGLWNIFSITYFSLKIYSSFSFSYFLLL